MRGVAPLVAGVVALVASGALGCTRSRSAHRAHADDEPRSLPEGATFTTVYRSPFVIEGLTADARGNLYAAGRAGVPCPVWRVPANGGEAIVVGRIPAPCSPAGVAFGANGHLDVADGDKVYDLVPDDKAPPMATAFASGVPGANGIAFDRAGTLWVSDGATGQGRVWSVSPAGKVEEVFRVPPVANDVNGVDGTGGVGRDPRVAPPATVSFAPSGRASLNTGGSQHIVANGLAFGADGTLFVADTARGAIWRVELDEQRRVQSPVGCDTTFARDTLCLDDILVEHPVLEGADGIALDVGGDIWVAVNERNAIAVVTPGGRVREVFRNPPDAATRLRNAGPLEFPTSPFLAGDRLCVTQSDLGRRDNAPNAAGEVAPGSPAQGKISCLDRPLPAAGLPLPPR